MSVELVQTFVNALLLLIVAFIGGMLGLRRFEAIERSIADLRTELKSDIAVLRSELTSDLADARVDLKSDIAVLRSEQAQMRSEQGQMRSDLTHVALAVGARPDDAPQRHGRSGG